MSKSLAAFRAQRQGTEAEFQQRIVRLRAVLAERNGGAEDTGLLELAAQSGAPVSVLRALRERLGAEIEALPQTIPQWVTWVIAWLAGDEASRNALLSRDRRAILGAVGRKRDGPLDPGAIRGLLPGCLGWLEGRSLREIEVALGGAINAGSKCPRARELVIGLLPLSLSFVTGLVARAAQEREEILDGRATPRSVIESVPSAIRRGFDSPSKLAFAEHKKGILSRVQLHQAFGAEVGAEIQIDRAADYASLVALMRLRLGSG